MALIRDVPDKVMGYSWITAQNWKRIPSVSHYSIPWSCAATHSHLLIDQGSIKLPDYLWSSPMSLEKAASKNRPLKPVWFWQWNLTVHSSMILCVCNKKTKPTAMDDINQPSHIYKIMDRPLLLLETWHGAFRQVKLKNCLSYRVDFSLTLKIDTCLLRSVYLAGHQSQFLY